MDYQVTIAPPSDRPTRCPVGMGPACGSQSGTSIPVGALQRRPRVALYSHDTMGIGHMRRNLLISRALAAGHPPPVILLIAGACEVNSFDLPPGVDCLSLPALRKESSGQYRARHLDLPLDELIALRSRSIAAALEAFAPDVFLVDKVPRGAVNELDLALTSLRSNGQTRCVLGLRDVLDEPAAVRREWREAGGDDTIAAWYDAVWVYGDPTVYDPVAEYGFGPKVADKVRYTGYLDRRRQPGSAALADDLPTEAPAPLAGLSERLVLCMVGGGQDGAALAETFARADFPSERTGVLLTGPCMPPEVRQRLRRWAAAHPRLHVLPFVPDTDPLLGRADRVIAMGGYNTVCEVLSYEKPALIVPRVQPRREQLIRAERLRNLGLLDLLHPHGLSPGAITEWLVRDSPPRPSARERIDFNGLTNLPLLVAELLEAPLRHACCFRPERRLPHVIS
jgi:predicted glycosyltransferase